MTGSCHCGKVRITTASRPEYLNACNCSLCAKSGSVWGYFAQGDLGVEGETRRYMRADRGNPSAIVHFCPNCGSTTHFTLAEHVGHDLAGVNARLFDPADLQGIEIRFPNGQEWVGNGEFSYTRPHQRWAGQGAYL